MKELRFLIKKMQKQEIAEKLGIASSNISLWLLTKRIPKKHSVAMKKIYDKEILNESKNKK